MKVLYKQMMACLATLTLLSGCALIDEDTSDCVGHYRIDYRLSLELETRPEDAVRETLKKASDAAAATALLDYLEDIFSDVVHDLDLSFYDVQADSVRLHREQHQVEADRAAYSINLPAQRYMHLASANLRDNGVASLQSDDQCRRSRLLQELADTVASHRTGLFTARLPMELHEDEDQDFSAVLYMANSAIALVADTLDSKIRNMKVVATGFADGFNICDSTYRFGKFPIVRMDRLELSSPGEICEAAITFPSRVDPITKAETYYWEYRAYVTVQSGSVTETRLTVKETLPPGGIHILKVKVLPDGSLAPADSRVGVSVTLDWNTGITGEIEL